MPILVNNALFGAREASQRVRGPSIRKREADATDLPTPRPSAKRNKQGRSAKKGRLFGRLGSAPKTPIEVPDHEDSSTASEEHVDDLLGAVDDGEPSEGEPQSNNEGVRAPESAESLLAGPTASLSAKQTYQLPPSAQRLQPSLPPSLSPTPEPVCTYASQRTIKHKKERIGSKSNDLETNDATAFYKLDRWISAFLLENKTYVLKRKELQMSYKGIGTNRTVFEDIDGVESWASAIAVVKEWFDENRTYVRVDVVATVEETRTARSTTPAAAGPRRTATTTQLSQLASDRAGDTPKSLLLARWQCFCGSCKNRNMSCWQPGRVDDHNEHYPLLPDVMDAWCEAIVKTAGTDRVVDEHEPPAKLAAKLVKHKEKGLTSTAKQGGTNYINNQGHSWGSIVVNVADAANNRAPLVVQNATSSPPIEPPSSQVEISEQIDDFFLATRAHPQWRSREGDLEDIQRKLVDERDLSLAQMAKVTLESWVSWRLKEGQWERFQKVLRRYRKSQA